MSEADVLVAKRGVAEVEGAIARLVQMRVEARAAGRDGLCAGDWSEWWLAESSDVLSLQTEATLRNVLDERVARVRACEQVLFANRVAAEQSRMLEDRAKTEERQLMERVAQATGDDRFAAQAHWRQRRQEVMAADSMNAP